MIQHGLWKNIYQHRRYIWRNAWNDLRYRYAGTGMGVFWNIIHPFIEITIYTIIFSLLFSNHIRGVSYRLYVTMGILTWGTFTGTIQRGASTFIEHARYVKQLNIPLEIFMAKIALTYTVILHIYFLLFLPVSVLLGNQCSWKVILLPVFLLLLQGLAFGMILTLANLRVLFPDIKEILQAFVALWRWTLPVIYPETALPESIRRWLFLNPPYIFLRSIRHLVLEQELPGIHAWGIMIAWGFSLLWIGARVHRALQAEVQDAL